LGVARASLCHGTVKHQVKHFFYASGWKKFEHVWDLMIRARQLTRATPLLEVVLARVTRAKAERGKERDAASSSIVPHKTSADHFLSPSA
jgi:hypothetical protein